MQTAVRRQASRLAAGGDPLHPTPRPWGAGVLEEKRLGCGVTAARRQASRLAGLMCFSVCWRIQTAVGRQALRLAPKTSRMWKHHRLFALQRWPCYIELSQLALFDLRPTQAAGEQSGDRQRREKALPFLKEEKSEHERAPPVCESRSTSLRATLRAPPSKWAVKGFFP